MKKLIRYSDSIYKDLDFQNQEIKIELELLISDLKSISDTIFVYIELHKQIKDGNAILFNDYYLILDEALANSIIMNLSKVFDNNSKARSLKKLCNCYLQNEKVKNNKMIKEQLKQIIFFAEEFTKEYNLKFLRDKYFAHLDKELIFSSLRLGYTITDAIDLLEQIENINDKLIQLFEKLYSEKFPANNRNIKIPLVQNLIDVEKQANEFLDKKPYLTKIFYTDSKGIHFKK